MDVRNSVSQSVMTREMLDTIPTGKDPFAVGQLIAGVTTNTPDVGGTQIMQQPTLQVHGSSNNDNVFMVDNVQIQHIGFGGNQTGFYFNDGLMDEISYQTSTLPAEAPVGGVQINMIPRDGGNQFHGGIFATGANESMQSNNLDDELRRAAASRRRTASTPSTTSTSRSAARSCANRLWFFSTFRRWAANNYLGNTFTSQGAQALDDQRLTDVHAPVHDAGDAAQQVHGALRPQHQVARPPAQQLDHRQHQRADLVGRADHRPQLHRPGRSGARRSRTACWPRSSVFTLPVNYNLSFQPDAAPDAIATFDQIQSIFTRRVAAPGHQHRADVHLRGLRVLRHRLAQPQDRRPGAHRLVAGAVRDPRRHRADRQQRRAAIRCGW